MPVKPIVHPLILFVGHRMGVSDHCARENLSYVILTDIKNRPRKKGLPIVGECDLGLDGEDLSVELIKKIKKLPITHVVALTERAVMVAAYLRGVLKLKGTNLALAKLVRDKYLMKKMAVSKKIPVAQFELITSKSRPQEIQKRLGNHVVLKARASSGGRHQVIVTKKQDLKKKHLRLDFLVEKFVTGKEISVESFVSEGKVQFFNITEYVVQREVNVLPAFMRKSLIKRIREFNARVIKSFGIERGLAHLEIFITPKGELVMGEVALRPPGGYIMDLLKLSHKVDSWDFFLSCELGLRHKHPGVFDAPSAAWILHPGAGKLKKIHGEEELKQDPNVLKVKIKVTPGQQISFREGSGQDVGYVLFKAKSYHQLLKSILRARRVLTFQMGKT